MKAILVSKWRANEVPSDTQWLDKVWDISYNVELTHQRLVSLDRCLWLISHTWIGLRFAVPIYDRGGLKQKCTHSTHHCVHHDM